MNLTILEKLTLLLLDDEAGKWVTNSNTVNYLLAAGIIFQLTEKGMIEIEDKKIIIKKNNMTSDIYLNEALDKIEDSWFKNSSSLISKLASYTNKIKDDIIQSLLSKGILKREEGKVLFFFSKDYFPMINSEYENALKAKLLKIITSETEPCGDEHELMLGLISIANIEKKIFQDYPDHKELKKDLKAYVKENKINSATNDAIVAAQTAMIAAVTTSVIASN